LVRKTLIPITYLFTSCQIAVINAYLQNNELEQSYLTVVATASVFFKNME